MANKIVTFGCQKNIFVYEPRCGVLPMPPCRYHETIEKAQEFLKTKGITDPKIITEKTIVR